MPFIRSQFWQCLLFSIALVCICTVSRAQSSYANIKFRIDSLTSIGLPKSALVEVDKLDRLARKNNNSPQIIKAVVYRITLQSYLEENALVAIIETLKSDIQKSVFPVKPVLQSLLADIYWRYYQQNRWRIVQRSTLEKPDADFANWDIQTLINQTSQLYKLSLQQAAALQSTKVDVLEDAITGDKDTRYLRPTLYDLLLHRALDFYLSDEPALPKPLAPFNLEDARLFANSLNFAQAAISTTDTASTYYQGIKFLQQATRFRLAQNNPEALADLDLRRLLFLYSRSHLAQKDSLHLGALNTIAQKFASQPISAEALTLIGNYYKQKDDLKKAYEAYQKAISTYPQSLGGKNAAIMMEQLNEAWLNLSVEEVNVPNKPLLAAIQYKNTKQADIEIYKLSTAQLDKYQKLHNETANQRWSELSKNRFTAIVNYLNNFKPVQTQTVTLQDLHDYRLHTTEIKLEPLSAGTYVVLINSRTNTALAQVVEFTISRLAYVARKNPDDEMELRVMDRETGEPLKNVKVEATGQTYNFDKLTAPGKYINAEAKGLTDAQGMFKSDKLVSGSVSVKLITAGDTLIDGAMYLYGQLGDDEEDDDPTPKTILFTDRQIYRPGQTVYFKGLHIETLKRMSKVVANHFVGVTFKGANDKDLGEQNFTTNEFGTFSGTFIIPQAIMNGTVTIKTADGEINIQVEEYKRPTFKVEFAQVKESYRFNDSVKIKGTVMAFSGYGLSQARVIYQVRRSRNYDNYMAMRAVYGSSYFYEAPVVIATDTINSDNQGVFNVRFKATTGDRLLPTTTYQYHITATVTDAVGETHTGNSYLAVGRTDIRLAANVPAVQLASNPGKAEVSLTTLNAQRLKGSLKIVIHALQSPDRLYKHRLWSLPDQHNMTQEEYKKYFPEFTYANEDQYAYWPKKNKVGELAAVATTNATTVVDLAVLGKQPSGVYEVLIQAQAANGDTASLIRYLNLVNEPARTSNMANWVLPVYNGAKAGDKAEFLVGTGVKTYMLSERYQGAKLLYSKWIRPEKQQKLSISLTPADEKGAVQFMMMYQNRLYSSYQPLQLQRAGKRLDLKLLTFRDKLQPGQIEEWKLQVSGLENEKQAAEVLAGMYDASLDDVRQPNIWGNGLFPYEREIRYFDWRNNYSPRVQQSEALLYVNRNYQVLTRSYERLNLFGYNYYGGYNNAYQQYLRSLKDQVKNNQYNKQLENAYKTNAALVKNGYDISGTVLSRGDGLALPGVTVKIKGTGISTSTNSYGIYHIKVPKGGVLQFSYVGYLTQETATQKAAVINVTLIGDDKALNEMVAIGYGTTRRSLTTGAVVRVRGASSADTVSYKTIRIDEPVGNAPVSEALQGRVAGLAVAVTESAPNEIFTGVDIMYPDGSRRVNGRLIPAPQNEVITIRKNFVETAFFYPQLRTDENGQVLISFTMPESLTKWRFRTFAHTKDMALGFLSQDVITQKQLMVSANMPRFLREGDTVTFSARVANLNTQAIKGKVQLQLFNGVNMQPVSLLTDKAQAIQQFAVNGNANKAIDFTIIIPQGLDALTYRLTATSDAYSDGEENTLPVLPNRSLVTESMPMMVRPGQTKVFNFDKLINNKSTTLTNKSLTLEYTQNPAWYAVQAMPYLMEFPYECSEQTFSRYFANTLSAGVVAHNPQIKTVFERWKLTDSKELLSNLEKNSELKAILLEETPWLKDAATEQEQKKRIALLFDLNKLSYEQDLALEKLQKQQLPGGGFPWFGGTHADRYITQHIVAGIGQLYQLKLVAPANAKLANMRNNVLSYLDAELLKDGTKGSPSISRDERDLNPIEIHAWYARSYHLANKLSSNLQAIQQQYLQKATKQWPLQNVYEQALIALTMQRYDKPEVARAIIRSLMQTAQQSAELGMYWARNQSGWYWYQSPVETQALLIELFTEVGNQPKAVEEMKIWLLRNKQTNNWRTTKATAAACYALLMKGDSLLAPTSTSAITVGGKALTDLKPALKAETGTGYLKTNWTDEQIKPAYGRVEVANTGKNVSWGAMHWQYTEQLDKITPSKTDIKLERKYYIEKQGAAAKPLLIAIDAQHQPKKGDLLKVVVYLKAGRDYEYVHLKDMRPAGTEPVDVISGYKYQDGLYYYQVTKDVATNFFISSLNKGNYVFEYRLRVAQPGNYSTGISSVQSMYAPEFNAHSQGSRMMIVK